MRSNRFASLLLTGKVASLPLLISQARADVTPTYLDMIDSTLRVIEIPSGSAIRLQSIAADSNASQGSTYAGSGSAYAETSYAAQFCTNAGLPTTATFVVTGVNQGDMVVLAAASNKNDPINLGINSRLTLGSQGLILLGSANISNTLTPLTPVKGSVSFNVPTANLLSLGTSGRFYVQAIIVPSAGAIQTPASWQFSELDEISVGACTSSTYGTTYGTTY